MNSKRASAIAASLIALFMLGCSTAPPQPAVASKGDAAPGISAEAQKALAQAEADIKLAESKFALWTSAESAFKAAQEAARAGDSAGVINQARYASEQVKRGLAQIDYPSTEKK